MTAEYQVRIYDVREGEMEAFVEVFAQVVEVRRKLGFEVVGAWRSDDDNRFVWVVGYDGPGTFEEASRRYYESPERAAIQPEPGSFLTNVDARMMRPVEL